MLSIKTDFQEKQQEIETLLDFIDSKTLTEKGNATTLAILKSASIMMLYNIIESTTVLVLEKVHEAIKPFKYDELPDRLKNFFVDYYLVNHKQKNLKLNLDGILSNQLHFPSFENFTNRINLFSGNLDAKSLNEIFGKYSIGKIETENMGKLLEVKNKRNQIAHGEKMFKECCRNLTIQEIELIKKAVFDYLEMVLFVTEKFLSNKRYLTKEASLKYNAIPFLAAS